MTTSSGAEPPTSLSFSFAFDQNVTFFGATVVDVDGSEVTFFQLFDESDILIRTVDVPVLGDNSVQRVTVDPPLTAVRRAVLVLGGSGAVTRVTYCLHPAPAN